jgi:hypothetical protein
MALWLFLGDSEGLSYELLALLVVDTEPARPTNLSRYRESGTTRCRDMSVN